LEALKEITVLDWFGGNVTMVKIKDSPYQDTMFTLDTLNTTNGFIIDTIDSERWHSSGDTGRPNNGSPSGEEATLDIRDSHGLRPGRLGELTGYITDGVIINGITNGIIT